MNEVPAYLRINCEVVGKMLTVFLRSEVHKVGFRRAVVGLSGGIDSALTAFLGARALGPQNVLAVLMPYKTSRPDSLTDALAVVEQLGLEHRVIDITPQIDAYYANENVPREEDEERMNLRKGNKMARERMTILYDLSQAITGLVLGTSNKTELLLGYGTLYGDMASAINPIGDLYKTQVRQMAQYLGLPERILKKVPTADLWVGQTDEDQLGFSYLELDQTLYFLVDQRLRPEEVVALGFEERLVNQVARLLQRSQFKRCPPVIAKVSERTINRDFRYSRDWGY
ncbi:MAG TPA: NAD+ synthase [Armatimonadetes bacterium]|nr:NAD+ synthase [Armatimonadota bacterium]